MKKLLVILAVLLTCLLAFAACDNGTNENKGASENKGETNFNQQAGKPDASHTHAFGEWETTKNATCTTEGEKVRYCTCGEQQASTVAMLGHTEVTDKAVAATCTTSGLTEGKHCSTCYEVIIEQKTVEALGHTEVTDKAVAATCTTAGLTEGKHCSVCNTTIVAQAAIEKLSHNYVNEAIIKNATCIAKGSKKLTCENCSAYITQEYELEKLAATEINKQALNYVGEIIVYDKQGKELGLATGFVYSQDGKIITNYHVIEDAYSAKITINGKSYQITQVLAYDSNIDLAVLKVNSTFNNYAKICKNPIEVGSTVYAIGSSRGMTNTFSQGIVTYYDRVVDGVSHLQHDASITNGNSGGPLINEYGEVVGINTWGITNSQNLNFAVFTKELDNLEFDTPMTMAEFYEKEYSAFERIKDYVIEKGIYNSDGNYYRLVLNTTYSSDYTGSYSRAIYYYVESNSITFDYVINNGDYWVYFKVYDDVDGLYYWHYLCLICYFDHSISDYFIAAAVALAEYLDDLAFTVSIVLDMHYGVMNVRIKGFGFDLGNAHLFKHLSRLSEYHLDALGKLIAVTEISRHLEIVDNREKLLDYICVRIGIYLLLFLLCTAAEVVVLCRKTEIFVLFLGKLRCELFVFFFKCAYFFFRFFIALCRLLLAVLLFGALIGTVVYHVFLSHFLLLLSLAFRVSGSPDYQISYAR